LSPSGGREGRGERLRLKNLQVFPSLGKPLSGRKKDETTGEKGGKIVKKEPPKGEGSRKFHRGSGDRQGEQSNKRKQDEGVSQNKYVERPTVLGPNRRWNGEGTKFDEGGIQRKIGAEYGIYPGKYTRGRGEEKSLSIEGQQEKRKKKGARRGGQCSGTSGDYTRRVVK